MEKKFGSQQSIETGAGTLHVVERGVREHHLQRLLEPCFICRHGPCVWSTAEGFWLQTLFFVLVLLKGLIFGDLGCRWWRQLRPYARVGALSFVKVLLSLVSLFGVLVAKSLSIYSTIGYVFLAGDHWKETWNYWQLF